MVGAPEDAAKHFVEHHEGGVGQARFHFTGENDQRCQPARRIEPREMLGAQNGCFPGDCRVARSVNPLFPIRADVESSDGLKAFNDSDKVPLSWRFRPFAHPREQRSVLIVFDCDQRFQSFDRLGFQSLDEFLCACFRARARAANPIFSKVTGAGSKILCPRK